MFGYERRRRSRHCGCAKVGSKVQGRVAETSASWRGNVHCDAWDWRQVPVSRFPAAASQAGCKLCIQHSRPAFAYLLSSLLGRSRCVCDGYA